MRPSSIRWPILAGLIAAASPGCHSKSEPADETPQAVESTEAEGPGCMVGCSVPPPETPADEELAAWLQEVVGAPAGTPSLALDTLLFHRQATVAYLDRKGSELEGPQVDFLLRELARTHARVAMRLVDEHGVVRGELKPTRVPLGVKKHLAFEARQRLQPFETNGTAIRVGLGHIWSRY